MLDKIHIVQHYDAAQLAAEVLVISYDMLILAG